MHSETHPIGYPDGAHDGSLMPLAPLGQHGLRIGGLDPSDVNQIDALKELHPGGSNVTLSAESGDPQKDRDLVTIGRHTLWNGSNLWPGQELPPTHFNMAANVLRVAEGLPQEGNQQVPEDKFRPAPYLDQIQRPHSIQSATDTVKDEMDSRVSKWSVITFGELQQPGAVGTEPYNEVTDGPNPNGPNFTDNAPNSHEQEQAVETWVNMAVDLLNRGEPADSVIAQLAHDGCPDPQGVLQRAQQQPQQSPVSDSIGQDPFDAPPADQGTQGNMQSTSVQPPVVTGKVRIKGTTMTGSVADSWEDTWGRGIVRIALDEGGSVNVAPEGFEPVEVEAHSPVSEVQAFIDGLPAVEPHRAGVETRIENLKQARLFAVRAMKTSSFSEQVELDRIASSADEEILALRAWLHSDEGRSSVAGSADILVATSANEYRHNALGLAQSTPDRVFEGSIREAAAIWAHESPFTDPDGFDGSIEAAVIYARNNNMSGEQTNEFIWTVRERLAAKEKPQVMERIASTVENDGPAEALFF